MHYTTLTTALVSMASLANAKVITIAAGKEGLSFSPDSVTAEKGDVVQFTFDTGVPHSVAQGDFKKGCSAVSSGGFFSGVLSNSKKVFEIQITNTDPIFFYCTVDGHCPAGMVGAINPSSDETLKDYTSNASSPGTNPSKMFGGSLVAPGADSSSSAAATTSTMASKSSSMTSAMASMSSAMTSAMGGKSSSMTSAMGSMSSAMTSAMGGMSSMTTGTATAAAPSTISTGAAAMATAAVNGLFAVAAGAAAFMV